MRRTYDVSKLYAAPILDRLIKVLDGYRGEGASRSKRNFAYLSKLELQRIIERDYLELNLKLFPAGAWKSTVIMAGSILESILFDVLSHPMRLAATNSSSKTPKKGGNPIDIEMNDRSWNLSRLIEVAADTNVIPEERKNTIDQTLREYRNFVHPHAEVRANHACTESEAGLAKYGLDGVCEHLERTLT